MPEISYDSTGKLRMDGIYNQADPTLYFRTLSRLDYVIPEEAKRSFQALISARRQATGRRCVKIVDVGSSYGINAALLKHGLSMGELNRLYGLAELIDRGDLLARDRAIFRRPTDPELAIVGVDQAENAVAYALETGLLDAAVTTNLERDPPSEEDRAALAGADLVISTGCFGYVTHRTLERILDATGEARPWMAHFVLRMFGFEEATRMLAARGYVVEKAPGLFRQRRFVSDTERERVLKNLAARQIDPAGAEENGWYFAELHVARPREDAERMALERLLGGEGRAQ